MTALEKKVFTSSNPMTVLLSCPPLCGHFSIQESAKGGLSYKVKKAGACLTDICLFFSFPDIILPQKLPRPSLQTSCLLLRHRNSHRNHHQNRHRNLPDNPE